MSSFTNPTISDSGGGPTTPITTVEIPPLPRARVRCRVIRKTEEGGRMGVRFSITLRPTRPDDMDENRAVWGAREPVGHIVLHGILPKVAAEYHANQIVYVDLSPAI